MRSVSLLRFHMLHDILMIKHVEHVIRCSVLEILAQLGEAVEAQYVEDGVVCPPAMRKSQH